ncbi:MAG: cation diffusion facilitator family transporter [Clostridiaceae bacterium]|nr:cation diffusion facilitator family transporter [Clostridiaceae bacterium]
MITILGNLFIKNAGEYQNPQVRRMYGIVCSMLGVFLNLLLFLIKFFTGFITGSVAVTADAFNNLSDAASCVITLAGFRLAGRKPDKEHPFGHGRIEYVSGFAVSILILLMGLELINSSVEKIITPQEVIVSTAFVLILVFSIIVKLYMAYYNYSMGKKLDSAAMKATAVDSLSDSAATAMVLASMGIAEKFRIQADGYCGVLVAVFILWAGYQAARETLNPLLGKKPDPEFIERIHGIVMAHEEIVGVHDVIVHDYGPGRIMISLHAEVPGEEDIYRLHDIIEQIETELDHTLGCESVIHMDPVEANNEMVQEMRKNVSQMVQAIDNALTIHDFRMVLGESRTKLIFDVVTPQEYCLTDQEVRERVAKQIAEKFPGYSCVIKVEKEYI